MPKVRGLTEVVIWVRDMKKALAFYRDVLGLPVMAQPDARGAVFLQVGEPSAVPQQVVLVPLPPDSPPPVERQRRALHHLGLEIGAEQFDSEGERLESLGHAVRRGEHPFLPLRGLYLDDPDGNEVELIARKG